MGTLNGTMMTGLVAITAALMGVTSSAVAQAAALDDPTIVAIFDAANTRDIATGALAKSKGTSKEIREFGAMLVRDHTRVQRLIAHSSRMKWRTIRR